MKKQHKKYLMIGAILSAAVVVVLAVTLGSKPNNFANTQAPE